MAQTHRFLAEVFGYQITDHQHAGKTVPSSRAIYRWWDHSFDRII
ncbi:MAG: hypothetical protein ACUVSL_10735 [Chloroflexus sp.]